MIPWHILSDPATVVSFAAKVEALERNPMRKFTGIGRVIEFGVRLITEKPIRRAVVKDRYFGRWP